jgi:hypothetical protein
MSHDEKINMVNPIHLSKSVEHSLDYLNRKGETIFDFAGSDYVESLFYLYLLKKYKSDCYVGMQNKGRRLGFSIDIKVNYTPKEMKSMEEYFNEVASQVADCIIRGKSIIIIPLQIKVSDGYHANVLIYRKNNNELEHFEPHGKFYNFRESEGYIEKTKDKLFNLFVKMINIELIRSRHKMPPIKYTKSNDVCPYLQGMQNLEAISLFKKTKQEPGGYCVAWSMFFTELCLKNPEIPSSLLLDNIYDKLFKTKNASDYLKKVIRGYSGIIYEKFTKMLSIFFKEKVTISMIIELSNSDKVSDRIRSKRPQSILNLLIELEIHKLDPAFDSKTEMKNIKNMIKMMTSNNSTRKYRKEKEKVDNNFRRFVWKKKILQNYDEFNENISPLLDEDKMTMIPFVQDRKNIENAILTKVRDAHLDAHIARNAKQVSPPKAKTEKKISSPKAKTMKKISPPVLAVPHCKANEIINPKTGKCMRITTMIKQIIKKNNIPLKESDIDLFIDLAREKRMPLRSEEEITRALNILMESGIFKPK